MPHCQVEDCKYNKQGMPEDLRYCDYEKMNGHGHALQIDSNGECLQMELENEN